MNKFATGAGNKYGSTKKISIKLTDFAVTARAIQRYAAARLTAGR